ncbi:MAG: signal peptidase I [bacterium]|nr:signal peptidase I [bacterium]
MPFRKIILTAICLFIFLGLIGGIYFYRYFSSSEFTTYAVSAGLGKPFIVPLSGTGSMYPTFPKGHGKTTKELSFETVAHVEMYTYPTGIFAYNKRYFQYSLGRGDIVSFENDRTKEITIAQSGEEREFLKRVYALPGDSIEFRDGIAYLNAVPQKEQYIARPRSTFGGVFLNDCKIVTIPDGKIFVMGDNRKISADSRSDLGLVSIADVDAVIPYSKQIGKYDKNWRDTALDLDENARIKLDKQALLKEINQIRAENSFKPLAFNTKLEKSATRRGETILKYDDLSPEATKSGYTMEKSMREAGYSNITWSEFPLLGYYENDEYLEAVAEYPKLKQIFIDHEFEDIGIAEVTNVINGCPQHVIVTQFGGYVPPNYTPDQISSWKKGLASLREVYPGWQSLLSSGGFYVKYKTDIDRVIYLMDLRIKNMEAIVKQMESNQWLTEGQQEFAKKDIAYGEEQTRLSDKLNSSN